MVKHIRSTNGTMTLDDLKNYTVVSRPVQSVSYRNLTLHTIGVPAGGSIALNILKTLEQFPMSDAEDVTLTAHRAAEAMRFGYGARAKLGDPAFIKGMQALEDELLDEDHAIYTRKRISDNHTLPVREYDPEGLLLPESHGTSHISTADKDGMAVSLTTTVNLLFGAQIMEPESGIIL